MNGLINGKCLLTITNQKKPKQAQENNRKQQLKKKFKRNEHLKLRTTKAHKGIIASRKLHNII